MRTLLIVIWAFVLCACAADHVRPAAQATGLQVTALVGDLSTFSEAMKRWTDYQRARIGNLQQAATLRAADAERDKAVLRIANAHDDAEIERILTEFGTAIDSTATAKLQPPAAPSLPDLPVQPLAGIAKALSDIERPEDRQALLEFLIDYAKRVHDQLKATETSEGSQ